MNILGASNEIFPKQRPQTSFPTRARGAKKVNERA